MFLKQYSFKIHDDGGFGKKLKKNALVGDLGKKIVENMRGLLIVSLFLYETIKNIYKNPHKLEAWKFRVNFLSDFKKKFPEVAICALIERKYVFLEDEPVSWKVRVRPGPI